MQNSVKFDKEWASSAKTVKKLLNQQNVSKDEWHLLFTSNSRITSWTKTGCDKLLDALKEELAKHTKKIAKRIHSNDDDFSLLRIYDGEWSNFGILLEYLPLPFTCINSKKKKGRGGITRSDDPEKNDLYVREVLTCLWNESVFESIKGRLLSAAMKLVVKERSGETIDSSMIVSIRESFVNYDREVPNAREYRDGFEATYAELCVNFYETLASETFNNDGIINYMYYANGKLIEEDERARKYLDHAQPDSYQRVLSAIADILVVRFQEQILKEAPSLIEKNEVKHLRALYLLINRTSDGISPLLDILANFIRKEGLDTMRNNAKTIVNDGGKFVEQLFALFNKFTKLVTDGFCNDVRFLTTRDQAFQEIVNSTEVFCIDLGEKKAKGKVAAQAPESKCPELLASYCDLLLRKCALTKKHSSTEIDEKLNSVLLVLKYVSNKDVFVRYYKSHLGRRLILELSADQDKEEALLNKFREYGMPPDFVTKLYQMLQDVDINKDLCAEFKRVSANSANKAVADCINLKVLNAGAWNHGKGDSHVSFPSELDDVVPEMEEFYKTKHTGRKLNWAHNWSTALVTFVTQKGKYELDISAFQMAVLFGWNDRPRDKISYEGLRLATQMQKDDLIRTILSLSKNPKVKEQILLSDCQPIDPKNFNDSTMFWINHEFAVIKGDKPQARGRVTLVNRINMNQEQSDETAHQEILRLREFRIQEAIVKIMKMRRVMLQNPLHNELVDMLKFMFAPTRRLIKQQIEWLIENDYIKRDDKDVEKFIYIT